MFRTVPLFIIRSISLYCSSVLILLASCQQTCMTYTIAVCTVVNCWWWTGELSETRRALFQKWIWEISASSWFYYENLSQCTVSWTSYPPTFVQINISSFFFCFQSYLNRLILEDVERQTEKLRQENGYNEEQFQEKKLEVERQCVRSFYLLCV